MERRDSFFEGKVPPSEIDGHSSPQITSQRFSPHVVQLRHGVKDEANSQVSIDLSAR